MKNFSEALKNFNSVGQGLVILRSFSQKVYAQLPPLASQLMQKYKKTPAPPPYLQDFIFLPLKYLKNKQWELISFLIVFLIVFGQKHQD